MGALEDLGYSVNQAEADTFGLDDLGTCSDFCPAAGIRRHRKMLRSSSNSTDAALSDKEIPPRSLSLSDEAELSLLEAAAARFRKRSKPATEQVKSTQSVITDSTVVTYLYQENGNFISRTIHRSQVEHLI
eukprot:scaffold2235_cov167-Amphora_coffeaeformis.AAC.6